MRDRITQVLTDRLGIDWSHPLAQGLVWCGINHLGAGPVEDLVTGRQAGGGTWSPGPSGLLVRDWSVANAASADLAFTSGAFTVAAKIALSAVPGTGQFPTAMSRSAYTSESVNTGWSLDASSSNSVPANRFRFMVFRNNAVSNYGLIGTTTVTTGAHLLVGTSNGSNLRTLYLDGQVETTIALNINPLATSGALTNLTSTAQIPTAITWAWARELSAGEVLWLHADPFAMLMSAAPRTHFFFGPGVEVLPIGDLSATESADVLAAIGSIVIAGNLEATESPDTFLGSPALPVGDLVATDSADTFAAVGVVPSTRLVFSFNVQEPATAPARQRLIFSFDVVPSIARKPARLVFAFNVATPGPRLVFGFDVIPVELFDASLNDAQQPIAEVARDPADTALVCKQFSVTSNLATPADRWSATFTGTGAFRTRSPDERYTLKAGLVENGQRQLFTLIDGGVPDFHTVSLAPKQASTVTITGRDRMVYLQDGRFSRIYRYGQSPQVVAGQQPIEERNGLFHASEIARDVVAGGGLTLAWQCPDYKIWDVFQAVGRPLDILLQLVAPFSLVDALKVDVFSDRNIVYCRQRSLTPRATQDLTLTAKALRLSALSIRSYITPKIGRVVLRGRRISGITTTPPAGVPIPHDTELVPAGGGSPVPIAPGSRLLPSGAVENADGSTLGTGTVRFTAAAAAIYPAGPLWAIPIGTIVSPDGLLTYTLPSGFAVTIPPAFNVVQTADGSVTTLHP